MKYSFENFDKVESCGDTSCISEESRKLDAFEHGYKSGWSDCVSAQAESEAEIIEFTSRLFDSLLLKDITIDINHRNLVENYINNTFDSKDPELVADILRAIDKIQKKSRQEILEESGKGLAVRHGIQKAMFDNILIYDSDFSYSIDLLIKFYDTNKEPFAPFMYVQRELVGLQNVGKDIQNHVSIFFKSRSCKFGDVCKYSHEDEIDMKELNEKVEAQNQKIAEQQETINTLQNIISHQ